MRRAAERAYRAQAQLLAGARAQATLPRLVLSVVLIVIVLLVLTGTVNRALLAIDPVFWRAQLGGAGNTPLSLLVLLLQFGALIVAVWLVVLAVHGRRLWDMIGPFAQTCAQFWAVFRLLALIVALVWVLPPYDMEQPVVRNMEFGRWLMLLPFGLAALLVQVSAEEILFRGHLQQTLAARFSHPLVWTLIPSALFALGHYMPSEAGDNAQLYVLWAFVFGLLMADLTARSGTLGPAIAVHLINNCTALLLVSLPDNMSGLALYVAPYEMADTEALRRWLGVDFAFMIVCWLGARLAVRA
ncbi:MAG: lysostaphin resistance A-like protein [Sedimentitalea sp.]